VFRLEGGVVAVEWCACGRNAGVSVDTRVGVDWIKSVVLDVLD